MRAWNARAKRAAPSCPLRDGGPGIPEDQLEQRVRPVRPRRNSRSRETGGTGIGLTIARNIVTRMGGTIALRNHPDGGLESVWNCHVAGACVTVLGRRNDPACHDLRDVLSRTQIGLRWIRTTPSPSKARDVLICDFPIRCKVAIHISNLAPTNTKRRQSFARADASATRLRGRAASRRSSTPCWCRFEYQPEAPPAYGHRSSTA